MPGKVNLYGLGDKGVNLNATPLHQDAQSWQQLQNAEFSDQQGEGGVKKRGALMRLNAEVLNSGASIQAIFNMPVETDVFGSGDGHLLIPVDPYFPITGDVWLSSLDGAAFVANASILKAAQPRQVTFSQPTGATISSVFYFPSLGNDPSGTPDALSIKKWNGTTYGTEIASFPNHPDTAVAPAYVVSMIAISGLLYIGVDYGGDTIVYVSTPGSGTVTGVGNRLAYNGTVGRLIGLASAFSSVWALYDINASTLPRIYRLNPSSESTWTLDHTFTSGFRPTGIGTLSGDIFVGMYDNDSTPSPTYTDAFVYRATGAGAWSTSLQLTPSNVGKSFGTFIEFDGHLYCQYTLLAGGSTEMAIYRFDGVATWIADVDVLTLSGLPHAAIILGEPTVFLSSLFWVLRDFSVVGNGMLLKRLSGALGGTWSQAATTKALLDGAVGVTGG